MLERALRDDCWDVIMVGFSLLNPSARERVLEPALARGVGTLIMFAVRRALSQRDELRRLIVRLEESGEIPPGALDRDDPLGFLVHPGGASSVVDAAYRFCRHEPGTDVILTGTGDVQHLEENLRSIAAGPLPAADLLRLAVVFGDVDSVSGN
jgi:L-galactose dehydrogenase